MSWATLTSGNIWITTDEMKFVMTNSPFCDLVTKKTLNISLAGITSVHRIFKSQGTKIQLLKFFKNPLKLDYLDRIKIQQLYLKTNSMKLHFLIFIKIQLL